jgi:hypothetical protein
MKGNIPIPELVQGEEVWLTIAITSVREGRTTQGKPFCDASAKNASGSIALKIWNEALEKWGEIKPGLWGIVGQLSTYQNRPQFVVSEYRPIQIEQYREHQGADPVLPKAYTLDIETLALPGYRDRVPNHLKKIFELGNMRIEQMERYFESKEAEEARVYQLGSLSATSGRIVCIAVHVGPIAGIGTEGEPDLGTEYVFGIDADGEEQSEDEALFDFINLLSGFSPESDEIVGHNIINFDLPFVFQRCLVHNIAVPRFIDLSSFKVQGVYDTMQHWWLGARKTVSLDDVAWALGFESSKTEEVEGSKVFDLYAAGKLAAIREYNLNDVRVTRKVYERMVEVFGR